MERVHGTRLTREDLPLHVRQIIEERLGARVVEAKGQEGGFSPGLAATLRSSTGNCIFVKASSPDLNPLTPNVHRKEARIAAALPSHAPVSRLLWVHYEGESGWVDLAFAQIDGHLPVVPWKPEELQRVQHMDLRADNIVLTENRVLIVDWPAAAVGAPWVDMLAMAPSVVLEGGPSAEEFFMMHSASRVADPGQVNAVLASIAGFFTSRALQPSPPGLPTLRGFQAAQGRVARRWLAERTSLM